MTFKLLVDSPHNLGVKAGASDVIQMDGAQTGTGGAVVNTNGTVGESLTLVLTSTNGGTGTWTVFSTRGTHWSFE